MRIHDDGNVGIGTNDPVAPLQVNGAIYAEGGTFDAPDDGQDPSGSDTPSSVAFVMPRDNKIGFWHDGYFRSLLHQDPQGVTQIGQVSTNYITAIKLNCGTGGDVTIQNSDGDAGLTVQGALTSSGLAYPTTDGNANQVIVTDGNGTLSFADQSGGGGSLSNIVEDTTPQLGGALDTNGNNITGSGLASLASYVFNNDANTGINNPAGDTLGIITGGQYAMYVNSSQQVGFAAGTHAAPSITFNGDEDTGISSSVANTLDFSVGGNDRMRLNSSGKLLIGTTSTGSNYALVRANGRIEGTGFIGTSNSSVFMQGGNMGGATIEVRSYSSYTSSSQKLVSFQGSTGSERGTITMAGTSTQYNTTSDERAKENIQDAGDAGAKIDAIQIRQFDWKEGGEHQDFGVIAQELQSVAPEAVAQGFAEEDMWSVDYSKLVPTLIKEIQSLRARVAELENE